MTANAEPVILSDEGIPLPRRPYGWTLVQERADGALFEKWPLSVIATAKRELDGKRWWHVSVARHNAAGVVLPTWKDLKEVKSAFIGDDRMAVQVFPPARDYVSVADVLHLWHCLDGDPVPDFTHGTRSL